MFAAQMNVENPTSVQILIAWREGRWIVSRNAVETGVYVYRAHAMAAGRQIAVEAVRLGYSCYILLREQDGSWEERPCPKPGRKDSTA
jgi:hypothetical protein